MSINFLSDKLLVLFLDSCCLTKGYFDYQAESSSGEHLFRELSAVAGAVTITCLMVCPLLHLDAIAYNEILYIFLTILYKIPRDL